MDSLQNQMKERLLGKDKNKAMDSTQNLIAKHCQIETKNENEYQQKAIQNFHMYQIKNKALKIRKSGGGGLAPPLELIP